MKNKILTMLEMQDAMNRKVNENWRDAGYPWYRAIWTECAEMLDHYGWKWWKHQKPDMQQVRLEVVDIWHFALSIHLLQDLSTDATAEILAQQLQRPEPAKDLLRAIEDLAKDSIETQSANIPIFAGIMHITGMSIDDLYRIYVGKNVLNFFRQDNGYKEGSYRKTWDGREDNEYLAEIVASLNPDSASFGDDIYRELTATYSAKYRVN